MALYRRTLIHAIKVVFIAKVAQIVGSALRRIVAIGVRLAIFKLCFTVHQAFLPRVIGATVCVATQNAQHRHVIDTVAVKISDQDLRALVSAQADLHQPVYRLIVELSAKNKFGVVVLFVQRHQGDKIQGLVLIKVSGSEQIGN